MATATVSSATHATRDAANPPAVVTAEQLTRRYGAGESVVHALRGVSLEVPAGQFAAVMGPSGSGKSTLMHLLAGLDAPTSGRVTVGGRELSELDDNELTRLRRQEIGFVFQAFNLLPMLTVEENILLPSRITGSSPDRSWVNHVIVGLGLADRRRHLPSELSGGQQQRVAIARAVVGRPTVMFADEPTGNLDSATGSEILGVLRDAVDSHGQTTVMVTHDPRAAAIADRVVFLADGRIVEDATTPSEDRILDVMSSVRCSSESHSDSAPPAKKEVAR